MSPEIINIGNVIIEIIIALLVLLTPIGIVAGIIVIVTGNRKEPKKKHLHTVLGIVAIVAPIVLLFVILSIWGLVRILTNTVGA
jgi:hypothetical protein